jgi:hypothetical protein
MQTIKELEVVSDDEEENAVPSTSSDHHLGGIANSDHDSSSGEAADEPVYRVAWDSSQSRLKNKVTNQPSTPSSVPTKAEDLKQQGNTAYKNGDNTTALNFYNQALEHCKSNKINTDELTNLQAMLHSNISAVFLRLNRPSDAISAAQQAHTLLPTWTRPLHRLAEAYLLCGKYIDAVHACQKGELLCHGTRNSEGHTEFTPVLDRIALKAACSSSSGASTVSSSHRHLVAGFTGRQLEVRSAGDEAWLGRPAPHIPELDGPLTENTALPSDDLSASTTSTSTAVTTSAGSLNNNESNNNNRESTKRLTEAPSTNNISARADSLATFHQNNHHLNLHRQKLNRTSFRCIQEAISAAQDGDRILLLKGVHNGMGQSVNINKRVLIEGQGELGETVIDQRANCPTFRITRGGVVIRNLDIDHTGFREALLIEGKSSVTPLIENCIIKCSGDDVVNTAGTAAPFFRRCVITAKKCGIRAFEKSHVTLESCIIEKCGEQAIKAMESAKIDATLCTLRDCEEDGIVVMDTATVYLLACTIQSNQGPGVDCSGQGKLEIRGGEISKNDGGGIFLWDSSFARLDGARLDGGRCPVMLLDGGGRVHATSCMIKGTIRASEEAWQGILKVNKDGNGDGENVLKNKLIEPDGRTDLLDEEEAPFRFIPNKYTRKQYKIQKTFIAIGLALCDGLTFVSGSKKKKERRGRKKHVIKHFWKN